jgi:hypothetical protein
MLIVCIKGWQGVEMMSENVVPTVRSNVECPLDSAECIKLIEKRVPVGSVICLFRMLGV